MNREKRILNPSNKVFKSYGLKISELDHNIRSITREYELNFEEVSNIFQELIDTVVYDEKMAAIGFLTRFKKLFNDSIVILYKKALSNHCNTWAFCDSSMIKIIGPYLAKKQKSNLAKSTIKEWSCSSELWVKRASLVIFLKRVMIKKDFDEKLFYNLTERLIDDDEDYIKKALGWMIKTCSKNKPNFIFQYLMENRDKFDRSTLRTSCEKLNDDLKQDVLNS
ncbi:MAG: hypothetical protein GF317_09510 [Candidatus Lokiarchaeota archaeon]|nr:hypothetical protein [Candidatus Lokiarchaeota archaeon]MBD3199948.1 hypothetical protein [Candidatus Lokiarchaeota archaeon]